MNSSVSRVKKLVLDERHSQASEIKPTESEILEDNAMSMVDHFRSHLVKEGSYTSHQPVRPSLNPTVAEFKPDQPPPRYNESQPMLAENPAKLARSLFHSSEPQRMKRPHYSLEQARPNCSAVASPVNTENSVSSIVRHLTKPQLNLTKFSGNPLDYRRFLRQFTTKILNNTEDFDERLNYLEQFTSGEAHQVVAGYSYLDAERGYTIAMHELEERYGDPEVIATAFVKRALNWQTIKPDNAKAFDEFSIFLTECEYAVNSIEAVRILEYSENIRKILAKLPYRMHDRWRSLVQDLKMKGYTPKFSNLVQFVRKEAKNLNDPVYGQEAISQPKSTQQNL